ncbi:hypothetical protein CLV24_13631 [Pontibacter ummariensis]|uniref:Uncharacterized protein n=1 Tax=Pontibacter ummariensis TaxID=1610492 RepID=A0A239L6D7_9BACT|nr:hypothetical protein CLV24_13631 [Pontibacter ummariensis]SNT25895.1 hypothetical protein SAMN06296052_13631 [Pontibacter ummariensis]
MFTTSKIAGSEPEVLPLARFFSVRLEALLSPFLEKLDKLLDRRLVSTLLGLWRGRQAFAYARR